MGIAISTAILIALVGGHWLGSSSALIVVLALSVVLGIWEIHRGWWQLTPSVVVGVFASAIFLWYWGGELSLWWLIPLSVCAALGLLLVVGLPLPHLAEPSGPHAVGMRVLDVGIDQESGGRDAQLHLWYPASQVGERKTRWAHSAEEAKAFSGTLRAMGAPAFLYRHFQLARTNTHLEAPPAPGRHQLVVFNHGGGMWPLQNFSLMEELASHGYVVCSISHPGDTAGIVWADGDVSTIDKDVVDRLRNQTGLADHASYLLAQDVGRQRQLLPALAEHYKPTLGLTTEKWAERSTRIVESLIEGNAGVELSETGLNIDASAVAYVGMSLGGSVAYECCFRDPRAAAGINLDGMNWCFDRIGEDVPGTFLQLYGDPEMTFRQVRAKANLQDSDPPPLSPTSILYNDVYYAGQGGGAAIRLALPKAAHMTFTDLSLCARGPFSKLFGTGSINGRLASTNINTTCRRFLDWALSAEADRTGASDLFAGKGFIPLSPVPAADRQAV